MHRFDADSERDYYTVRRLMKKLFVLLVTAAMIAGIPVTLSAEVSLTPSPLIWGADLQLNYQFGSELLPTTAEIGTASGYLNTPYFRDPDNGSLYRGQKIGYEPEAAPYFSRTLLRWNTGIQQSLMYDPETEIETAAAFLRYVGYREWHIRDEENEQLIFESSVPEADGQLLNTLRFGVDLGHVEVSDVTTSRQGWDTQFVGEWGPSFLGNDHIGEADFSRVGAQVRGFVPLHESEPRIMENSDGEHTKLNSFTLYAGAFAAGDYAWGSRVPLSARRSILRPLDDRSGLGGTVRGYESGRYDATLKVGAGGELRAVLPAIGRPDILPGLVAYVDGGFWRGLEEAPADEREWGTALASGAGASISLFDLATLVFYSRWALDEKLVDGSRWDPFAIGFGYHF